MPTYSLRGYNPTQFATSTGTGYIGPGDSLWLAPEFDASEDHIALSVTDDDPAFDGDWNNNALSDDPDQTGTATTAAGDPIASGGIYIQDRILVTDGEGNSASLYTVSIGNGMVAILSTPELVPGVQYQVTGIENVGAGNAPAYADLPWPTYDPDLAQNHEGGTGDDTILTGGGDDSVWGAAGADSIDGGAGNDSLIYGLGGATQADGDLVRGGDGDDFIDDYNGLQLGTFDDTLMGEGGNDLIYAGHGDDLVLGGTGSDTLHSESGNDTVDGGDGNDLIIGDAGNESLLGGAGNDILFGGADSDTLLGGLGSDLFHYTDGWGSDIVDGGSDPAQDDTDILDMSGTVSPVSVLFTGDEAGSATAGLDSLSFSEIEQITGGQNADLLDATLDSSGVTLSGGGGDDVLLGGSGDDRAEGGAGNDVIATGDGADTIVFSDGHGADSIADFDLSDSDGDGRTQDQLDLGGLTNGSGAPVGLADVTVTDNGLGSAVLGFPNGESITLIGIAPAQVSTNQQLYSMGVPCYGAGTRILTPQGERPIETLRRGDLVCTTEAGPQPVLWCGARSFGRDMLDARPELRPIHIRDGTIGNRGTLCVSPQHGVVLPGLDEAGQTAPGAAGACFVRAVHLADHGTGHIRRASGARRVSYHHILLPRHATILANGALSESLYPGPFALSAMGAEALAELFTLFPGLARNLAPGPRMTERIYGPGARRWLNRQSLIAAARRGTCPLLRKRG